MKRRLIGSLCVLLLLSLFPIACVSEGEETVRLARVLYTLCREEDDRTMMKVGSVIMNRVESPWFPDTLSGVLSQAQQFPCGRRYDARSLRVAQQLLDGARELPEEALYYRALDASDAGTQARQIETSGGYAFYGRAR